MDDFADRFGDEGRAVATQQQRRVATPVQQQLPPMMSELEVLLASARA